MIAYPVNAMNAPSSSVQDRVQNSIKQESTKRIGPLTEDEMADVITCRERIYRYTRVVAMYKIKAARNKRYEWSLNYYTKRLNWWKKYCAG